MSLFPASPTNGQTVTVNGILYTYSSSQTAWVRTSASLSNDVTFAGNVNVNGTLTLTGPASIKTYTETGTTPSISASTLTIDLSTGSFFSVTVNSNITTINITNTPATVGVVSGFVIVFTYNGTPYSVTWPASIRWSNGNVAPTLTSTNNKRDVFTFFTTDNGTSYNGFITGQNI